MSGTTVQTQRIKDSNLTLSLSGLPAGNYVLKIVNNGKDLQSMIISK
jgi:hypothetical protein